MVVCLEQEEMHIQVVEQQVLEENALHEVKVRKECCGADC